MAIRSGKFSISASLPPFARIWHQQRAHAHARLEQLRLEELRSLTEADAARMFAQLEPLHLYPLRPTSGLVEQQAWFSLLRDQQNTATRFEVNP